MRIKVKRNRNKIHFFALLCLAAILLSACAGAPALDEIKPRVIELIEASYEVNDIFFGEGLPVIERGSAFAEENHIYYMDEGGNYDYVTEDCPYQTVDMIKAEAEKVYSSEYLASIYETTFVGVADENTGMLYARYLDTDEGLKKSNLHKPLLEQKRMYDYDTMEIVKPSNGRYINVEIESYLEGEDERLPIRLTLVKEGEVWLLDSPTY